MIPTNNKIIVRVDLAQKDFVTIGGITLQSALLFEVNYRERSPTIATVVHGNDYLKEGDVLLCHHNLIQEDSPYRLEGDLFSVPFSKILFARIKEDEIEPICGNLICNRIVIPTTLPLPPEQQKTYDKIYEVENGGWTKYKKGHIIHTRPAGGYDIVYNLKGEEKRITKVDSEQICGYVK